MNKKSINAELLSQFHRKNLCAFFAALMVSVLTGTTVLPKTAEEKAKEKKAKEEKVKALEEQAIDYSKEVTITDPVTAEETEYNFDFHMNKVIKMGIIGLIVGLVLMIGIYLLVFIFKDAVRTALDLEFAGLKLFGTVPGSGSKKSSEEDGEKDSKKENKGNSKTEEAYRRIAYNILLNESGKVFTLVPVDKISENDNVVKSISEKIRSAGKKVTILNIEGVSDEQIRKNIISAADKNDIVLVGTKNIKDCADAIPVALNSDGAIILTSFGKSREKDLVSAVNDLAKTKVELLGGVILL